MTIKTKVYNGNQTVIPSELRKKFNIKPNDTIEWTINKKCKIEIEIIKALSLEDMIGRYTAKRPFNSVKEIKKIERGEKL
ncbi:MAG: AbrB/MazE/SpoVT family DNA-binding domain-containing protein [Methanobrevibacter sp.]|jgi:AbrB family looped-hinge helix DNA binding protein|nr:AbrB/MazE/SpoVT family DNA-binding domain-containing protein [Candidatus Methanoflexus mossambicus]